MDELASMRSREGSRYVFMGDFNAGIDHIVLDKDIIAGQMQVKSVASSDHAALLATIVVQ